MSRRASPAERVASFAPRLAGAPRVLVLGTMPGRASLAAAEYYAHPRNAFWPIVAGLTGVGADADYDERMRALGERGVALWDVLASCERPGSLDSAIVASSATANDVATLIAGQPTLVALFFNGKGAARLYRRHIGEPPDRLSVVELPSTSPAFAAMPVAEKRRRWLAAFAAAGL